MREEKLLIFAGTFEGRTLLKTLSSYFSNITACVATEYGEETLENIKNIKIISKRMTESEMVEFMILGDFNLVVDATHPYAKEVTENIKKAASKCGKEYIRYLREGEVVYDAVKVKSTEEAVSYLNMTEGNILLTTGSKELSKYTKIADFSNRLYIRVLPSAEVIAECKNLGIKSSHIIAAQGPFSLEFNLALLKQFKCAYIVTKNTGTPGGLVEKTAAAEAAGAEVVLIEKPYEKGGCGFDEILEEINKRFDLNIKTQKYEFFPFFMDSKNKAVLVAGGGNVATRRVLSLLNFNFKITIVAPEFKEELKAMLEQGKINLLQRTFQDKDLKNINVAIFATDDRTVNCCGGKLAKSLGIITNVADEKDECDFYFPALGYSEDIVIGINGGGEEHKKVKVIANKIREAIK